MALKLGNNIVKINRMLQEDNNQNMIESDIIVPDVKPDVVSILHADGEVKLNSKETYKDAIVLRGTICFKILYMSDDPSRLVCSSEHTVNFDQTVDIPGIDSNMICYLTCRSEYVECNIINGRKLNVKAVLKIDSKVIEPIEVAVISDIGGSNDVQVQNQSFESYNEIEYDDVEAGVIGEVDIPIGKPAIKEILRTDAYIKEKELKITSGKAIAKGILQVSSLYVPDMEETPVDCVISEVPFSEVLDIPQIIDGADITFNADVRNVSVLVKEDDDGDTRVLEYEVGLNFKPIAVKKQTFEVVSDAYAMLSKLEIERNPIKVTTLVAEGKAQLTLKDSIQLSFEMPPARQVYNILCREVVTGVNIEDDRVNVEGVVELTIIYMSDEGRPVGSQKHHTSFHQAMDIRDLPAGSSPKAVVNMEDYSYDLVKDRQIEIKFVMAIAVRVFNQETVDVVTKVDEVPLDEMRIAAQPSMIVYYIQNGDTLWGIAKKYLTTVNDLLKVNNIDGPDSLGVGQQLLIPRVS